MANFFCYDASGQKRGPFNEQQLQALAAQGKILPTTPLETDTGYKGVAGQIPSLTFRTAPPPVSQTILRNAEPVAKVAEKGSGSSWQVTLIGIVLIMVVGGVGWSIVNTASPPAGQPAPEKGGEVVVQVSPADVTVPRTKQSANSCRHGAITKAGSSLARSLLCEAAQHLSRSESPLGVFVRRLLQKKTWNKAIVAGARKLATIAYHMLKNKEPYRYAAVVRTQDKLRRLRGSVSEKKIGYQRYRFDDKLIEHIENRNDVSVRFVPPISDVYAKEGLPPARSFDKLSVGEQRAIKEMGLTEHVRKSETVQVIVKPKKQKQVPCAKVE